MNKLSYWNCDYKVRYIWFVVIQFYRGYKVCGGFRGGRWCWCRRGGFYNFYKSEEVTSLISKCEEELIPRVGKSFPSLDVAFGLYGAYATRYTFDTRLDVQYKNNNGTITQKQMVFSREGQKNNSNSTYEYVDINSKWHWKTTSGRCSCKSRIRFKFDAGGLLQSLKNLITINWPLLKGPSFWNADGKLLTSSSHLLSTLERWIFGHLRLSDIQKRWWEVLIMFLPKKWILIEMWSDTSGQWCGNGVE